MPTLITDTKVNAPSVPSKLTKEQLEFLEVFAVTGQMTAEEQMAHAEEEYTEQHHKKPVDARRKKSKGK